MVRSIFVPLALGACASMMAKVEAAPSDFYVNPTTVHSQIASTKEIEKSPNFVFSPHSISLVAHLAQFGAAGKSKEELVGLVSPAGCKDLSISLPNDEFTEIDLNIVSRIYSDKTKTSASEQQQKFLGEVKQHLAHPDDLVIIDFNDKDAAATEINSYISDKTKGHITDLVTPSSINPDIAVMLLSAIYFKARWGVPFLAESTIQEVFHTYSTTAGVVPKQVSMMQNFEMRTGGFVQNDQYKAIALSYVDPHFTMYVIEPSDIVEFEAEMRRDATLLDTVVDSVRGSRMDLPKINLKLPKFKIPANPNSIVDLIQILRPLGVEDIFTRLVADFSPITGDRTLYVSDFVHQAYINVDEYGTEAAAATVMQMSTMSFDPSQPIDVAFNRPFVFQIRYRAGSLWQEVQEPSSKDFVLFSGRVADPTVEE